MRQAALTLALALVVTACASKHFEDDKRDPNYQSGNNYPVPSSPTPRDGSRPGPVPDTSFTPTNAVVGLVASGLSLAANKDYYRSNGLTGRCLCRSSKTDTIDLPCQAVEVIITDVNGRELTRVQPNAGEFAFSVPKGTAYRLRVASDKFQLDPPMDKNVYHGDDVVLRLYRKPK